MKKKRTPNPDPQSLAKNKRGQKTRHEQCDMQCMQRPFGFFVPFSAEFCPAHHVTLDIF
jgi:hypothetical protein